jgi:hypothetical protein
MTSGVGPHRRIGIEIARPKRPQPQPRCHQCRDLECGHAAASTLAERAALLRPTPAVAGDGDRRQHLQHRGGRQLLQEIDVNMAYQA